MTVPVISKRAAQYVELLKQGFNNNADMAKEFGVVSSSSNAVMQALINKGIVKGELKTLGRKYKKEYCFELTGKPYEVSTQAIRLGKIKDKTETSTTEQPVKDRFDFYIYPFARTAEAEEQ